MEEEEEEEEREEFMSAYINGVLFEATNFFDSGDFAPPSPRSFTFSASEIAPGNTGVEINIGFSMYQQRSPEGSYATDEQLEFPEITNCTAEDRGILCGQMGLYYSSSPTTTRADYTSQSITEDPETPFQINFTELSIEHEGILEGTFSGILMNREDESDKARVTDGRFRIRFGR